MADVSNAHGFALIGLLVVIAIILILSLLSIQGIGGALGGDETQSAGRKMDTMMRSAYGLSPCDRRRSALGREIRAFHGRANRYPRTLRELGWLHGTPGKCPESRQAFAYDRETGAVRCHHCQREDMSSNSQREAGGR